MRNNDKKLRIFYAPDGPGDVIGTFQQWKKGNTNAVGQVSVAFSSQFFNLCEELDAQTKIVVPHNRSGKLDFKNVFIEHRPKPKLVHRGGFYYYLGEFFCNIRLIITCLKFKSDIVVLSENALWPLWAIVKIFRIRIIAVLHCTLWPSGFRPMEKKDKFIQSTFRWFWENVADATLGVSYECIRQVTEELAPKTRGPSVVGLSSFNKSFFDLIPAPDKNRKPFRVLFAGRIEKNKGVFNFARIAKELEEERPDCFKWEICGSGSAMGPHITLKCELLCVARYWFITGYKNELFFKKL